MRDDRFKSFGVCLDCDLLNLKEVPPTESQAPARQYGTEFARGKIDSETALDYSLGQSRGGAVCDSSKKKPQGATTLQVLANGLISGMLIALLALAFLIVYWPTRVFFIALGGIYAATPFVAWQCSKMGLPWFLVVAFSLLFGTAFSVGCEFFNHGPLERKNPSPGAHLVSSLGIFIALTQVIVLIWGSDTRMLREGVDATVTLAGIRLTRTQLLGGCASAVLLGAFYLWLWLTHMGLHFRALADNPVEYALRGHNVSHLRRIAFGLSGALAASTSLLMAFDVGFAPYDGLNAVLLAIVAVIVGGRGSFLGPVIGGVALGLVRAGTVWHLSARWQDAVSFALLALALFLFPHGLLGRKRRLEAEA